MRMFAALALLLTPSIAPAGDRPADGGVPLIERIGSGASLKYWRSIDQRTTATRMEPIYAVEGRPAQPPPEVAAEVASIWRRLVAASPVRGDPTVYVADCSDRTAESLLSGATRMCWGYLRQLETEDQVAAILGHEMSHLVLGHTRSGRSRGTGFAFLQGLYDAAIVASLFSGAGAMYATIVGGNDALAVPSGWLDRASQAEEMDADRLGIDLMVKAGFNAGGLPEVFELEGMPCGAPKQRRSPAFALMMDTSRRFTHPEDGKRSCAATAYVNQHYAAAYDRVATPLPWTGRKAGAPGVAFFKDVDEADRLALQARALHLRLKTSPTDRAAKSSCVTLLYRAHAIAAKHPDDRDLRRFESAVALGCNDEGRAYQALLEETLPGQRTVPGQFQALAVSALSPGPATAKLYGYWLREDFAKGLATQKPSVLGLLGLKSDAVDRQREYQTFTCVLDLPELKAAQDDFCHQTYDGTPAGHTCSHDHDFPGVCASSTYFPNAKPMGPRAFLISQSRWYAAVLGAT